MIIVIGGIILLIGMFFLISQFFSWVSRSNDSEVLPSQDVSITASADSGLTTRITTSGAIVGDEDFRSIRISVTKTKRTLEIMKGYQNIVTEVVSFKNNQPAYESFLRAIELEGFNESKKGSSEDERGFCPTGTRTIYEAIGDATIDQRLWSGSCSNRIGTFDGDTRGVIGLFQAQIPNYSKLVRDVDL